MLVVAYIDDILIATKGYLEKHHTEILKVFQLLINNHRYIEMDKYIVDVTKTGLLRFIFSGSGSSIDQEKWRAIVDWPRPTSRNEAEQLLGWWNLYRQFIQKFSGIVSPIPHLVWQDIKFEWIEAQEAAFLKMMILFTSGKTPILRRYEPDRPALLETDDSHFDITRILSQKFEDGKIHCVRFVSSKVYPTELHYDVYDKEMIAVVLSHWVLLYICIWPRMKLDEKIRLHTWMW